MAQRNSPSAPDFTNACVVMFGINLLWILILIWAVWGFAFVALAGWGINRLISRVDLARRRAAERYARPRKRVTASE